jgi:hypothetical protein
MHLPDPGEVLSPRRFDVFLFSVMAFAQDDVCYDCLDDYPLYRVDSLQSGDDHPSWWVDYNEALSVTILFGVIEGGGGLGYTPGGEPVPIDPQWLVVAATYTDERDLAAQVDELEASLDGYRLAWTELSEVAGTTRLERTVAIVTPTDEAAAVDYLVENSKTLAGLAHPTVVFVQEGGAALEKIGVLR